MDCSGSMQPRVGNSAALADRRAGPSATPPGWMAFVSLRSGGIVRLRRTQPPVNRCHAFGMERFLRVVLSACTGFLRQFFTLLDVTRKPCGRNHAARPPLPPLAKG